MSNKYYVDMGSSHTLIYSEIPLLNQPSCVVIKDGLFLRTDCAGDKALEKAMSLMADEQLIFPISEGMVRHPAAAVAMLKTFLKRAGVKTGDEVVSVVPCCFDAMQKTAIEKVFLEAGYKNLSMTENIMQYAPLAKKHGHIVIASIGSSRTDVGIINQDEIVVAYSVNIGGNTVNERIKNRIEKLFKLKISSDTAEKLKIEVGSLYKNDTSSMTVTGNDIITGVRKSASVHASDINGEIEHCFRRIINLIIATIDAAPAHIADRVAATGLFLTGGASLTAGLNDYIYAMTKMNTIFPQLMKL